MQNIEAKELLVKYREGKCSEQEIAILESWYLNYEDDSFDLEFKELRQIQAKVWTTLPVHNRQPVSRRPKLWPLITAAASLLIMLTAGLLMYKISLKKPDFKDAVSFKGVTPGGNKAVLTLGDGSKISLTDASNGKVASQAGMLITKTKDGQLVYQVGKSASSKTTLPIYNTITTPKGGQYQVNLPDGTKVWLNAASSLRYPIAFKGKERRVELNGEGYFEVAHNKEMPFRVQSGHQVVEVLGTHFNVNAYPDEDNIRTTLIVGSVRVNIDHSQASVILKPGQQALTDQYSVDVNLIDTDDVIAWKNNYFVFTDEELGSIMRKIGRWYNVDVICPPELASGKYSGTGSKSKTIQQTLNIMELTGTVHFKVEGRRITVMK